MAVNLKKRLQRIRDEQVISAGKKSEYPSPAGQKKPADQKNTGEPAAEAVFNIQNTEYSIYSGSRWEQAGYEVLKRIVKVNMSVPDRFPAEMDIIVRDLARYGGIPEPSDFVFFDLETTGLSGGAGTLAFLGSFGRFRPGSLVVSQYLLLDYPGESDFLEAMKAELLDHTAEAPAMIVSYNGKTFDSQILKNRCLMNAIVPPDYFHADLLHPSRRLWKNILPDCSQGTIETNILGLDRTGDTPGALAPDIWFNFLKTNETRELMGICDHNIRDIAGLASILLLMSGISAAPLDTLKTHNYDLEALALLWRDTALRRNAAGLKKTAMTLMNEAARRKAPRVLYALGLDLLKTEPGQGQNYLKLLASSETEGPPELKIKAFCALAKHAEWAERDAARALAYTESALAIAGTATGLMNELQRRRERLLKKINCAESS